MALPVAGSYSSKYVGATRLMDERTTPSCVTTRGGGDGGLVSVTTMMLVWMMTVGFITGAGIEFMDIIADSLVGGPATIGCPSVTVVGVGGISVEGAGFSGTLPDASCFKYIAAMKA